jgi:gamma-glutamylaminecyclotransferase
VPASKTILFVYGTLKRGERNHRLIADQEFLGEALTEPRYRVIDLGPHPGLVVDEANGLAVRGELYAVSDTSLAKLDAFEGAEFPRGPVAIPDREKVHAYYWNGAVSAGARSGCEWPLE